MKIAFTVLLILHFLTESLAAFALIGGPEGLSAAGTGGQWSMHYGFAALALASASLWVWPFRTNLAAVTAVLGVLLVFHVGLCTSLAAAGDQMAGLVMHAVLAVLSIFLFTQRKKWCTAAG